MTKENTALKPVYAGFWVRLFAAVLDTLITTPFVIAALYLLGFGEYFSIAFDPDSFNQYLAGGKVSKGGDSIIDLISLLITISYSIFFVSSESQATIGKRIMGIYIATKDGKKLSKNRAGVRFIFSIVSVLLFGIGLLMIIFTKQKTALHDLICGSRVFYGKKQKFAKK